MENQNDPLLSLVTDDAASLDRQKIANFLKEYVSFDNETKEIVFTSKFENLKNNFHKIEVLLLASKVKFLLFNENEGFLQKDLITLEIMPEGSIKSALKRLNDDKKIKKNKEGRYYLPNYLVNNIINNIK